MWNKVIGGFGLVLGVSLVVVGFMTLNPIAVMYGCELGILSGAALMTGGEVNTAGPMY